MSRAILVSLLVFCLSVGLSGAAPVPDPLQSLTERFDASDNIHVLRSLESLFDRDELEHKPREYPTIVILDSRGLTSNILNKLKGSLPQGGKSGGKPGKPGKAPPAPKPLPKGSKPSPNRNSAACLHG
ncbi:hypothetical protein GALMADRAFT_147542 [Galerina marginata CBS 339.88]|uniref:Uncharacterized protein n=1 Tax=Galerina marginata (strain CBS 339.88) TaxID=685588 RepID=A0A067SJG2_GALM3|nr:hypothetical protein GALMADRAFT_147542 [Galerina marginata CBS 339.88]